MPKGESRKIKLDIIGVGPFDAKKTCHHHENDKAARTLCQWLVFNTSVEFKGANINGIMSCLQGQELVGGFAGMDITQWYGKALFDSPFDAVADVSLEFEYNKTHEEGFLAFDFRR